MKLESIIVLILTLLIATLINLSEQRKCLHIDPLTYLINITVLESYPTKAIGHRHRLTKQQYTTLFHSMGLQVVERPVVWHANKKLIINGF